MQPRSGGRPLRKYGRSYASRAAVQELSTRGRIWQNSEELDESNISDVRVSDDSERKIGQGKVEQNVRGGAHAAVCSAQTIF